MDARTLLNGSTLCMTAASLLILHRGRQAPAAYGRYVRTQRSESVIAARAAWLILSSPNILIPTLMLASNPRNNLRNPINKLLFFFFYTHAAYRAIITPVFRIPRITTPMPSQTVLLAFVLTGWNAVQQTAALLLVHEYEATWVYTPQFLIGFLLAVLSSVVTARADAYLHALRARNPYYEPYDEPGIAGGVLFTLVSCPNYLAEICTWVSWAVACGSWSAAAFAFSTACHLATRALWHHRWYRRRFPAYPSDRKALIPFVF